MDDPLLSSDSMPPLHIIAKHAGVSVATVSRVLNKHPSVRPRTANQVMAAIDEINRHSVHDGARVSSRKTAEVAMFFLGVTSNKLGPIFMEVVSGVADELRSLEYRMIFSEIRSIHELENDPRRGELAGGVVLADPQLWNGPELKRMAELLPTVWVMGANSAGTPLDHIVPDNWAVGELAFAYLRDLGCPAVSYMKLPAWFQKVSQVELLRASSFLSAARSAGMDPSVYLSDQADQAARVLGPNVTGMPTPIELVRKFVAEQPRGTGLFVSTDREAAMLYPLLAACGVTPGKDILVVSCDNESPTLAPLFPRPASVDILAREIGRQAVARLLYRIDHRNEPPVIVQLPPKLITPEQATEDERKMAFRSQLGVAQ